MATNILTSTRVIPPRLGLSAVGRAIRCLASSSAVTDGSMKREDILQRLHALVTAGTPIVGAGAGTGLSAKASVSGGADLIIIYNSGRFRMAGRGSLAGIMPYGDANAIVLEMAAEVAPVIAGTGVPLLAGVCGTDPFRSMPQFLSGLRAHGFSGVQNFPTVGLIDGNFRANLEETGMSYGMEVEMIEEARRQGMLTTPYAFTPEEGHAMACAGADIVVAHCGLTTGGTIGAETAMTLKEAADITGAIARAAVAAGKEAHGAAPLVLCHGGPVSDPADAAFVLEQCARDGVVGFYGASSMERLPVEVAIRDRVSEFKEMRLN